MLDLVFERSLLKLRTVSEMINSLPHNYMSVREKPLKNTVGEGTNTGKIVVKSLYPEGY